MKCSSKNFRRGFGTGLLVLATAICATYLSSILRTLAPMPHFLQATERHDSRLESIRPSDWELGLTQTTVYTSWAARRIEISAVPSAPEDRNEAPVGIVRYQLGWPIPAWEYFDLVDGRPVTTQLGTPRRRTTNQALSVWQRGLEVPAWWPQYGWRFPFVPVWGGIAVSVGFWTVFIAVGVVVFRQLRQRLRRRSGRCAACGYPVCGSQCPECGTSTELR
jgi:hypothetical protein